MFQQQKHQHVLKNHTHTHTHQTGRLSSSGWHSCMRPQRHTHTVRMMTCQSFEAQELQLPLGSMLIIKRWGEMKGGRACGSDTFQERGRKSMKAPEGGGGASEWGEGDEIGGSSATWIRIRLVAKWAARISGRCWRGRRDKSSTSTESVYECRKWRGGQNKTFTTQNKKAE